MVNAEAPMLSTHADHLLDHVHTTLWYLRPCILLTDDLTNGLVLAIVEFKQGFLLCTTGLLAFFLCKVLLNSFVRLHVPVVVLRHNIVIPRIIRTQRSLRCQSADRAALID